MTELPPENTRQITAAKLQRFPMSFINGVCKLFGKTQAAPGSADCSARCVGVSISHYCEKVNMLCT